MPIIHHDLACAQLDLVANARKVLFVLLKNALKRRFQLKGCKCARPLELHGGIATGIHCFGLLVQFVGFGVVKVIEGRWAESRALGWGLHGVRMAASCAQLEVLFGWLGMPSKAVEVESRKCVVNGLLFEGRPMVATVRPHTARSMGGAPAISHGTGLTGAY
jgi:hypothetical protein